MRRLKHTALALCLGAALLAGCSNDPPLEVASVTLQAEPTANDQAAVAVDLVLVRDQKLLTQLQTVSAADWFTRKVQFLRDNPTTLSVFSWEIVPGQTLTQPLPADTKPAWGGLVYAGYAAPGDHRLTVTGKDIKLRFQDTDFAPIP